MSVFLVVHLNTASKTYFTKRKSMKLKPLEIDQQVNLFKLLGRRSFASQHNLSKSLEEKDLLECCKTYRKIALSRNSRRSRWPGSSLCARQSWGTLWSLYKNKQTKNNNSINRVIFLTSPLLLIGS